MYIKLHLSIQMLISYGKVKLLFLVRVARVPVIISLLFSTCDQGCSGG